MVFDYKQHLSGIVLIVVGTTFVMLNFDKHKHVGWLLCFTK